MRRSSDLSASISPLPMPVKGAPDLRFHAMSPWQMSIVPVATQLDFPSGTENGAFINRSRAFWNEEGQQGTHHSGEDLNGIGGNHTSLGDPVFAIGDGLVVFSGNSGSDLGKHVIVAHKDTDGHVFQSLYAHLDQIETVKDSFIARGSRIGTIGIGEDGRPAHLHFELRSGNIVSPHAEPANLEVNFLNPSQWINASRNHASEKIAPAPLIRAIEDQRTRHQ